MNLYRKIYSEFEEWKKESGNRALLVTGARQVGKTYAITEFMQKNFENFIHFDLVENSEVCAAFESASNTNELFEMISLFSNKDLTPKKTVIFIDEIQQSGNSLTILKYLLKNHDFSYVISGSLLGCEIENVRSLPVGSLRCVEMFPLDFFEFCLANGVSKSDYAKVGDYYESMTPLPEFLHSHFLDLFHKYLFVGGMPAVVSEYVNTHNLREVRKIQQDIVRLYKADISKYAKRTERLSIKNIFDKIPANLSNQSKRFNLASIKRGSTFDDYQSQFLWLIEAGVCIPTFNVAQPVSPLILSESSSYFKLFLNDVGLLTSQCDLSAVRSTGLSDFSINYGSIYENVVAQELKAHGFETYYFRNKSIGEIDFVIEKNSTVLPLEIKSGKTYKRHSAITKILATPNYSIDKAFVFNESNIEVDSKIVYLPIYLIDFLQKDF